MFWGESRSQKVRLTAGISTLTPPIILKEADINFVFKVLAKFGDYKDNKDIKKKWNF